ncbi:MULTISPECIES: methyltransferase domain-containing protein [unclassified Kribbella]|uniref:class I SAM-dependent methyltransferase n=1 Tax=unclassified Kribbella TaxID=2644121 RepID=UPI00340151BF
MEKEYVLDSGSDLGRRQLDYLAELLDPQTTRCLDAAGVRPGMRCLDVGAGGGSITRWLAERVGPDGSVVAVDLDTSWLDDVPGVEVHRHDINEGLPVDGQFDLIHERLMLMHLSRREEILQTLLDALAPGGVLVLGDFDRQRVRVLSAPTDADAKLFLRVQDVTTTYLTHAHGISYDWVREVDSHLRAAGLSDVHATASTITTHGGDIANHLHRNYILQIQDILTTNTTLTTEDLTQYAALTQNPNLRTWFYEHVTTTACKPPC